MSRPKYEDVAQEYVDRFLTLAISPRWDEEIERTLGKIRAAQHRYENVANRLVGPPWFVIALMHQLECRGDFSKHLHNGDPLAKRTVNVPAGRPTHGKAPFTWEESAWDAVRYDKLDQWQDWSVPGIAYQLEKFNGFGYREHGIPSPYLWSGSQHYSRGKFIRDRVFDPDVVSKQIGAMVLLRELCRLGDVALRASRA